MMRRAAPIAVLGVILASLAEAQEWTRFRGPNGAGVAEARFPAEWTNADFWKTELPGVGHSSPVLWGDRIFLTSGDEETGKRLLLGLDAKTGRIRWTKEYEAAKHGKHQLNSFASSTPTVDAERVYHCFATPDEFLVTALTHEGDEVWRRDLGDFKSGHGCGASPILVDGLFIVANEQGGQSSLLALDAVTGEIRWQTQRESQVHFYTPCIRKNADGFEVIFTNWEQGITALDAATGEMRWSADVFDKSHTESSIGSPVLAGDLVLGVCGWLGHGNEVVAVRPPASGAGQAEQVYRIDRGAPLCTTPLMKDGLLFLWSDNGVVTCADSATGDIHWTKRIGGVYYSSPIAAGDHVWNISAEGEVIVLAASREFQLAGRSRLDEGSHATPAIAGGVMYVRTFSRLFAIRGEE